MRSFRRSFIGSLAAGTVSLCCKGLVPAWASPQGEISSLDLSLLDDWLTPPDYFFVRSHSATPAARADNWMLGVAGLVAEPLEISALELFRQPSRERIATLECAENLVGGGLVSNARWTGLPLAGLLEAAQLLPAARGVRLEGADGYSRVVPLAKAQHPDTLIGYKINDHELPVAHGYPLRAIIPGWYGMDSVKWLRRIDVVDHDGNHTYLRVSKAGVAGPVQEAKVKAVFARPIDGAVLFGRRFLIRGAAWAGESQVRQVEVSMDGGASWRMTRLLDPPRPYAWVRWEFEWAITAPGRYELAVRARDEAGRGQPEQRDTERLDSYEQDSWQQIQVEVA